MSEEEKKSIDDFDFMKCLKVLVESKEREEDEKEDDKYDRQRS